MHCVARRRDIMYKIILVDDEVSSRNALCNCFPWNQIGFEVVNQFSDGQLALDYIRRHPVDVIFCDIIMPNMDGLILAQSVYQEKLSCKIVFLSAYKKFDYAQQALKYGVRNYLVKPAKYRELVEVFQRLKLEMDEEREAPGPREESASSKSPVSDKTIAAVQHYISQNYKDATLESTAAYVNLNPCYLSQYYYQKTGTHFSDELLRVRMERATVLLDNCRYKIKDVSEMVGYMNAKNFTKAFKKYYGKLPTKYRNDL